MRPSLRLPNGIRRLFRLPKTRAQLLREYEAEVQFHLAMRAAESEAAGRSAAEAREDAFRKFGDHEDFRNYAAARATKMARRVAFTEWVAEWTYDVKFACRQFSTAPGFVAAVVATLTLGLAATTIMASIVNRLIVSPPAYLAAPNEVRRVYATVGSDHVSDIVGYALYAALRGEGRLAAVTAYSSLTATTGIGAESEEIAGGAVTSGFFQFFDMRPVVGRLFDDSADGSNAGNRVVVISHELWQQRYSRSPSTIGQTVRVAGIPFTIIGVLAPGFTGLETRRMDFWVPMSATQAPSSAWRRSWRERWLKVAVRVRPGTDLGSLEHEASLLMHREAPERSFWRSTALTFRPLTFDDRGAEPAAFRVARWLSGLTLLVLVIACFNVANLLLARSLRRRREMSVRVALGASTGRLARMVIVESCILSFLGAIAAVGLSTAALQVIERQFLAEITSNLTTLRWPVIVFAGVLACLCALIIGMLPLLDTTRVDVIAGLKSGSPSTSGRRNLVRATLLIGECAFVVILLTCAGLFVRSLGNARRLNLGFEPDRVLTATAQWASPMSSADRIATFERIQSEIASLPGVEHTALAIGTPLGSFFSFGVRVPGRDSLPDLDGPWVYAVSPDYFATVGTALVAGRLFSSQDGRGTEPVTIIGETMAHGLWPSEPALGKCLLIGGGANVPCARIVGVVHDVRRASLQEKSAMQYYIPLGQERWPPWPYEGVELLARPHTPGMISADLIRRTIVRAAAGAYLVRVTSMQERVDPLLRQWRLGAALFAIFGALALVVALFGLYAVASYVVSDRMPEFGIRLALGSSRSSLVQLILLWLAKITAIGIAIGGVLALVVGAQLEPLLFKQPGRDPGVIAGVAVLIALGMLAAGAIPAARAMRVDPLTALRNE